MATTRAPRQSKEQAAAETRAALLRAGEEILLEHPMGSVLDQVKAPEVARRALRTTGAFYHHWASQDDYQRELIEYVLGPERSTTTTDTATALQALLATGVPLVDLIHTAGIGTLRQVQDNKRFPLLLSLWAMQGRNEQIRDLIRRNFDGISDTTNEVYGIVLEHYGLMLRPPFTLDLLTVVLTGLVQGLAIRSAVDPDTVPLELPGTVPAGAPDAAAWDLYSTSVLAIVTAMTTPQPRRRGAPKPPDLRADLDSVTLAVPGR